MSVLTGLSTLLLLVGLIFADLFFLVGANNPERFAEVGLVPSDTQILDVELIFPVASIFSAIAATGVVTNVIASSHRRLAILTALTSIQKYLQQSPNWSRRCFPGAAIRRIDDELPPEDYLAAYPRADARVAVWMLTWSCYLQPCASSGMALAHRVLHLMAFDPRGISLAHHSGRGMKYRGSKSRATEVIKAEFEICVILCVWRAKRSSFFRFTRQSTRRRTV
ncbi:MAG: hypothetical protein CMJ78_05660 [Planctomycetaceae bacterium]|nr:hypothetical protein [Planctomycetaceae bacterium]